MRALALGAQLGPRIATLVTYGVGYEGLGLFGVFKDRTHLVFNAGATLDPGPTRGRVRPFSLETGLDLDLDLDTANRWSFLSELAFAYVPGGYVNEVTLGAGFGFSPGKRLSMSIIALGGFVAGADRIGLLLGVAPKTDLW